MSKLSVIIAIFPYGDADTVSVAATKEVAIASWKDYMRNGNAQGTDEDEQWLSLAADNLATIGLTDKQDSGVFYRLNPMKAVL